VSVGPAAACVPAVCGREAQRQVSVQRERLGMTIQAGLPGNSGRLACSHAHQARSHCLPWPRRWVPLLFGLAGVLIGVGYPLLDEIVGARSGAAAAAPPAPPQPPSWPAVYACIALFVAQYAASGALEAPLLHLRLPLVQAPALATGLAASGLAIWAGFDRTPAGLVISAVTAVGGPLLEVGLINGPHLYVYSHPEIWGVPGWIAWVYFAGGPAVGLLGRRVAADLRRQLGSGPQQVQ